MRPRDALDMQTWEPAPAKAEGRRQAPEPGWTTTVTDSNLEGTRSSQPPPSQGSQTANEFLAEPRTDSYLDGASSTADSKPSG